MIIRVNIRANGEQLGDYMSDDNENDYVEIFEVDGREDADKAYLKQVIMSMELNGKLTKCKNPFLNVQINPAYGEDRKMTRADWYRAAEIIAEELNYQGQRRVITLHTKKGRTHAHVVWERYNHETGKVIPTKNSRLNAKFARIRIEKELGQKRTAWRNDKEKIKQTLTEIWDRTNDGAEFIKQSKKAGYIISAGTGNRPFMVVDQNGISCDLVRQLEGVRTKEVRARLRHEQLMTDKQAIEMVRAGSGSGSGKREREQPQAKPTTQGKKRDFTENSNQTTKGEEQMRQERTERFNEFYKQGLDFVDDKREPEATPLTPSEKTAFAFAENKTEALPDDAAEQERLRDKIRLEQEKIRKRQKTRRPGR